MASHHPGVGCPGAERPVTWLSPVTAWHTRTALAPEGSSSPQVSYPADTRRELAAALEVLSTKRERIAPRRHDNLPL